MGNSENVNRIICNFIDNQKGKSPNTMFSPARFVWMPDRWISSDEGNCFFNSVQQSLSQSLLTFFIEMSGFY